MIINPLIPRVIFAGDWIAIHNAFCLLAKQGSDAISDGNLSRICIQKT
jgi:hypothetical protein